MVEQGRSEVQAAARPNIDWANINAAEPGRVKLLNDYASGERVKELNEQAEMEIYGRIGTINSFSTFDTLAEYSDYRDDIHELTWEAGENILQPSQVLLLIELRRDEKARKALKLEEYKAAHLGPVQAQKATDDWFRNYEISDAQRLAVIKHGGAFELDDYNRLVRGEDPQWLLDAVAGTAAQPDAVAPVAAVQSTELPGQVKPFWSSPVSEIVAPETPPELDVPESQEVEIARMNAVTSSRIAAWNAPFPATPEFSTRAMIVPEEKYGVAPLPDTFWDKSTPVAVMPPVQKAFSTTNILPPMSRLRQAKFNVKLWAFNHQRLINIGSLAVVGGLLAGGAVELVQSLKHSHSHITDALNSHGHGQGGNGSVDPGTHHHDTGGNTDTPGHQQDHHKHHDHNPPDLLHHGHIETAGNRGVWGDVENIGIKHGVYLNQEQVHHYVAQIMAHNSTVSWANARDIPAGTHYVIPRHVMEMLTKKTA